MKDEVLCCCHNVTLSDLKENIELGVDTFEELQQITNIGTNCPPCREKNEELFNQLCNQKDR